MSSSLDVASSQGTGTGTNAGAALIGRSILESLHGTTETLHAALEGVMDVTADRRDAASMTTNRRKRGRGKHSSRDDDSLLGRIAASYNEQHDSNTTDTASSSTTTPRTETLVATPHHRRILLQGPSASGKSSLALEWACAMASQTPCRCVVQHAAVDRRDDQCTCIAVTLFVGRQTRARTTPRPTTSRTTRRTDPSLMATAAAAFDDEDDDDDMEERFPLPCGPATSSSPTIHSPSSLFLNMPLGFIPPPPSHTAGQGNASASASSATTVDNPRSSTRTAPASPSFAPHLLQRIQVHHVSSTRDILRYLLSIQGKTVAEQPFGALMIDNLDAIVAADADGGGGDGNGDRQVSSEAKDAISARMSQVVAFLVDTANWLSGRHVGCHPWVLVTTTTVSRSSPGTTTMTSPPSTTTTTTRTTTGRRSYHSSPVLLTSFWDPLCLSIVPAANNSTDHCESLSSHGVVGGAYNNRVGRSDGAINHDDHRFILSQWKIRVDAAPVRVGGGTRPLLLSTRTSPHLGQQQQQQQQQQYAGHFCVLEGQQQHESLDQGGLRIEWSISPLLGGRGG